MIRKRVSLTEASDTKVKELKKVYGISYSGAVNMIILKYQDNEA